MYDNVTVRLHKNSRWFNMIGMMEASGMLMVTLFLLLNPLASASTLGESEINYLNTIETPKASKNGIVADKQTKLEFRHYPFNGFMVPPYSLPGCPLCDSSVYSYCSYKLIHDSCCCDFPGAAIYPKPPQCAHYDCRLLYAKSCYEHALIKNCCCNNPY